MDFLHYGNGKKAITSTYKFLTPYIVSIFLVVDLSASDSLRPLSYGHWHHFVADMKSQYS